MIDGRLVEPLNAYKDKALTRIDQEDVATFDGEKQGEVENITEHVKPQLSRITRKRPWRAPNSLRDSNVSLKQETTEEQGVEARSLARNTLEG